MCGFALSVFAQRRDFLYEEIKSCCNGLSRVEWSCWYVNVNVNALGSIVGCCRGRRKSNTGWRKMEEARGFVEEPVPQ